jgi:hypothetical protein
MMRPDGPDVSVSIPTIMNTKYRVHRALDSRVTAARARIRSERNLGTWRRTQRTPVRVGTDLPVVLSVWNRLERLQHTLEQLAAQEIAVQVLIWNNSCERSLVDTAAASAGVPVAVHHSPRNIGGFGRFYLAREVAEAGHPSVVFVDDDQDFGPTTIADLVSYHYPRSLSGWWAFRFLGDNYGERVPASSGEPAHYVGTGGMISDTTVFRTRHLFDCPRRFWFVEDLWLCYVAQQHFGYDLRKSPAEFEFADDGRDLHLSLGRTKWTFLRYLVRHGWDPAQCAAPLDSASR